MNLFFLILMLAVTSSGADRNMTKWPNVTYPSGSFQQAFAVLGDINIAGIFTLSEKVNAQTRLCDGRIASLANYKSLRAMIWAVDRANRLDELDGIRLGFVVANDCDDARLALLHTLSFTPFNRELNISSSLQRFPVVAVVGPESSDNSIQTARMLGLFEIPQISYISTSVELSNKNQYPYFFRIIPSDKSQAQVIVDLLQKLNMTFVVIFYSTNSYGTQGNGELQRAIKIRDAIDATTTCFAKIVPITEFTNLDKTMKTIKADTYVGRATVFILFTTVIDTKEVFRNAARAKIERQWIVTEAFGSNPFKNSDRTYYPNYGIIALKLTTHPENSVIEEFNKDFQNSNISQLDTLWGSKFLQYYSNGINFSGVETRNPYSDPSALVLDSVQALVSAIKSILKQPCAIDAQTIEGKAACVTGPLMKEAISELKFNGYNGLIQFDNLGDGYIGYDVMSIFNDTYEKLGEYDVMHKDINWMNDTKSNFRASTCSQGCEWGQEQEFIQGSECCWQCKQCLPHEFVNNSVVPLYCESCPDEYMPAKDLLTCEKLDERYLYLTNAYGIAMLSFCAISIIASAVVFGLFIKFREEPVIKASSREICYIMFLGVFGSYALVIFMVLITPTEVNCNVVLTVFQLATTFIYGPLAIKMIRLYRLFKQQRGEAVRFINPRSMLVQSAITVFGQIIICLLVILLAPPAVKQIANYDERAIDVICVFPEQTYIWSVVYNACLVLLSALFSFKTRKTPNDFNENRVIGYCVYTTIVIWIAWLVAYPNVQDAIFKDLILGGCLIWNATVTCLLFYGSRLWMVRAARRRTNTAVQAYLANVSNNNHI